MSTFDHGSDVPILENLASAVSSLERDVHHGTCQVVGPNHLVRKQQLKRGVDSAQQAIAEIRFLPALHGVDICRAKNVNPREPGCEESVFGLPLISCESDSTSSAPLPLKNEKAALGLLPCRTRANSIV
jgi:hypothetical protein